MKKIFLLLGMFVCITLISLLIYLCFWSNENMGKVDNVEIIIGDSSKFSKKEIESAIKCVKNKFKSFKGCELKRIWYDEKLSNLEVASYLSDEMRCYVQ